MAYRNTTSSTIRMETSDRSPRNSLLFMVFLGMNFSQQQTSSLFSCVTRTRKNEKHYGWRKTSCVSYLRYYELRSCISNSNFALLHQYIVITRFAAKNSDVKTKSKFEWTFLISTYTNFKLHSSVKRHHVQFFCWLYSHTSDVTETRLTLIMPSRIRNNMVH